MEGGSRFGIPLILVLPDWGLHTYRLGPTRRWNNNIIHTSANTGAMSPPRPTSAIIIICMGKTITNYKTQNTKNSPTAMPTVTKVSRKNTYREGTIFMNPLRTQPPRSRAPHAILFLATPMGQRSAAKFKLICGLRRHFRLPDRRIDSRRKLPCRGRRSPVVDPGPGRRHCNGYGWGYGEDSERGGWFYKRKLGSWVRRPSAKNAKP